MQPQKKKKKKNYDKNWKLKLWQNMKTQTVTKLKNSNCDSSNRDCSDSSSYSGIFFSLKHRENSKKLSREHLIVCQGVNMFLLKDPFKVFFLPYIEICHDWSHNLSFWVLSQMELCHNLSFITIWVLSQFEFCHNLSCQNSSCHNLNCHNLSFFCSFVTTLVFAFCHNLSFWVVTIWVFQFYHNFSFWVSSQF